jgi:hypothetical protein
LRIEQLSKRKRLLIVSGQASININTQGNKPLNKRGRCCQSALDLADWLAAVPKGKTKSDVILCSWPSLSLLLIGEL